MVGATGAERCGHLSCGLISPCRLRPAGRLWSDGSRRHRPSDDFGEIGGGFPAGLGCGDLAVGHDPDRRSVVAGNRSRVAERTGKDVDDRVYPRVDHLVNRHEMQGGRHKAGLLLDLAPGRRLEPFAEPHPAAGQAQPAGERRTAALDEQDLLAVGETGGDGENGVVRGRSVMGTQSSTVKQRLSSPDGRSPSRRDRGVCGLTCARASGPKSAMCGRFTLTAPPERIAELLALAEIEPFPPRYNIAPTQPILIAIGGGSERPGANLPDRTALLVRWGLIPSWVKDPKDFPLLINARAETATTKNSFRGAVKYRRCLIPASGFYEWKRHRNPARGERKSDAYFPQTFGRRALRLRRADGKLSGGQTVARSTPPPS